MRVWLIHARSADGKRYYHTVEVAFETKEAAEYWTRTQGDSFTSYHIVSVHLFSLSDAKETWK